MPCAPDVVSRNWSTVYAYDENNNPTVVDFYNRGTNEQTLNIGRCKYAYIHYHLPAYPYSQADFNLFLMNSYPGQLDAPNSTGDQAGGAQIIRYPSPLLETIGATGVEEEHLALGADGNEIHTSTDVVRLILRWA